jgi:hypothetical protein
VSIAQLKTFRIGCDWCNYEGSYLGCDELDAMSAAQRDGWRFRSGGYYDRDDAYHLNTECLCRHDWHSDIIGTGWK